MEFKILVITGDQLTAGTNANVYVTLYDNDGYASPEFQLDKWFRDDFESGSTDDYTVYVDKPFGHVKIIEYRRDNSGYMNSWFLEGINVFNTKTGDKSTFPVHHWVKGDVRYKIWEYNTNLPQFSQQKEIRAENLKAIQEKYELELKNKYLPVQVKKLPEDETFSWNYKWNVAKLAIKLKLSSKLVNMFSSDWDDLEELKNIYTRSALPEPSGATNWRDDFHFARQRTHGCSSDLIRLCTSIPDKLGVTDEMLTPLLEGLTIAEAINNKKLFMVDLVILQGMRKKENHHICSPIALFFENKDKKLSPVAIQLEQQAGTDNPVFLPTDPEYTWLFAKMWYNNADAQYHQSCSHFGFTHLLMEGICVSAHRQLSSSHPIFKIVAPHFLFLIAANSLGFGPLTVKGGLMDTTMNCGVEGMLDLIDRGTSAWRVDVEGTIPAFLAERGVHDGTLSDFPYRDDALLIYDIIHRYVKKYVNHYYDTPEKLTGDWELQAWAKEVVLDKTQGGVGIKGVPGDGSFTSNDQLAIFISCIIGTCSISHAASNYPQYDEYAFPPNYPSVLRGLPPKNKDPLKEIDIFKLLPDKATTLDTMVFTKLLSEQGTKSLGDFEVSYVFDPPAKQFVREFRQDLKQAGKIIDERNKSRNPQYTVLHPDVIPNSISI